MNSFESNLQSRTFHATASATSKSVLCAKSNPKRYKIVQNVLIINASG